MISVKLGDERSLAEHFMSPCKKTSNQAADVVQYPALKLSRPYGSVHIGYMLLSSQQKWEFDVKQHALLGKYM